MNVKRYGISLELAKLLKNIKTHYQKQKKICPYETNSHRTDIKRLYDEIEQMNPEARYSIWRALNAENKLIEE